MAEQSEDITYTGNPVHVVHPQQCGTCRAVFYPREGESDCAACRHAPKREFQVGSGDCGPAGPR